MGGSVRNASNDSWCLLGVNNYNNSHHKINHLRDDLNKDAVDLIHAKRNQRSQTKLRRTSSADATTTNILLRLPLNENSNSTRNFCLNEESVNV